MKYSILLTLVITTMITACQSQPLKKHATPTTILPNSTNTQSFTGDFLIGKWILPKTALSHLNNAVQGFRHTPRQIHLNFDKERGNAFVGCNSINFSYTFNNNQLIINNLTTTRMACDNPFEAELSKFLRTPLTVDVNTVLTLTSQDGKMLRLTPP